MTIDPTSLRQTSSYDYDLPEELIAAYPPVVRGQSRMLRLHPDLATFDDLRFPDIVDQLRPHDLLVFNNARVIPARIFTKKETGGVVEVFVVKLRRPNEWSQPSEIIEFLAMTRSSNRLKPGVQLHFADSSFEGCFNVVGCEEHDDGNLTIVRWCGDPITPLTLLAKIGTTPLPPYIVKKREKEAAAQPQVEVDDRERYQNVFAKIPGAVAAPTAGLHFTDAILDALRNRGVDTAFVTLEVGPGTFKPVSTEVITDHPMHSENYMIDEAFVAALTRMRQNGGRLIAVGTTSMRVIEAEGRLNEPFVVGCRATDIFLSPLNPPRFCDGLLTNFHLPKSTLFALVAGFVGLETTHRAYQHAVQERYRFYSYGDCMLILKD